MQLAGVSVEGVRRARVYKTIDGLEYAHSQDHTTEQALHLLQRGIYALTKLIYVGIDLSWLKDLLQ